MGNQIMYQILGQDQEPIKGFNKKIIKVPIIAETFEFDNIHCVRFNGFGDHLGTVHSADIKKLYVCFAMNKGEKFTKLIMCLSITT